VVGHAAVQFVVVTEFLETLVLVTEFPILGQG
jgi:hypothetical protein